MAYDPYQIAPGVDSPTGQIQQNKTNNQMSSRSNPTPSATYNGQQPIENKSTTQIGAQPSQGLYGANQANLQQLLNLAKPTLDNNNKLVQEKNAIYQQMYSAPLSDEQKKALTPGTKLAIESGQRQLMDAQIKAINSQLSGYTSGIDNDISSYLNSVATMQSNRDNIAKAIAANPEVAQLYDPATLKSMGINAAAVGVGVVGGYDMGNYATNPNNVNQLNQIYSSPAMQNLGTDSQSIQNYISQYAPNSPITGDMVMQVAQQTGVDPKMLLTVAQNESNFGTAGVATRTFNPGNVGNVDSGGTQNMGSWENGLTAMAQNLKGRYVGDQGGGALPQPIDPSDPTYATAPLQAYGGLTQAGLDQAAQYYATTGTMPSLGLGSATATQNKRNAIINRAAQLNQGTNIATNKAMLSAQTKALGQQVPYLATVQRSLSTAEIGLQQLIQQFQDAGINPNDATIANKVVNQLAKQTMDSSQIRAFQAGLQEVSNEYQQVFSRGGTQGVTESVRTRANDIFDGNITVKDLQSIADELQQQGNIVIQQAQKSVSGLQGQMGGASPDGNIDTQVSSYLQNLQGGTKQTQQTQQQSGGFWNTIGDFLSGLF